MSLPSVLIALGAVLAPASARDVERDLERWLELALDDPEGALAAVQAESWLGPEGVEPFFRVLEDEGTAPRAFAPRDAPTRAELLLTVLERHPAEALLARARLAAEPDAGERERVVALDVLARGGSARRVDDLIAVAAIGDLSSDLEQAFERSLAYLLVDAPDAGRTLRARARSLPPELRANAARALSAAGLGDDLWTLVQWLGHERALDVQVLSSVAAIALRSLPPFDDYVVGSVRPLLESDDVPTSAAAARALGALEDPLAVPALVDRLGSAHADVRAAARQALQRVSGLDLGPDELRWRSWLSGEERWWSDELPGVLEDLRGGDGSAVAAAVNAVSRHRLYREELGAVLVDLLRDASGDRRWMACVALRQLGARGSAPELVDCLADDDERVRREAWQALRTFFGTNLPPDPDAWRDVVRKL